MKIEDIHKENFDLISKYNLKIGDKLVLKRDFGYFGFLKRGEIFTISHIHRFYGWILLKETEQLPQRVKDLLNFVDIK